MQCYASRNHDYSIELAATKPPRWFLRTDKVRCNRNRADQIRRQQ